MLARRIKAWLKLQKGKPPVLPSCIGRVHADTVTVSLKYKKLVYLSAIKL